MASSIMIMKGNKEAAPLTLKI